MFVQIVNKKITIQCNFLFSLILNSISSIGGNKEEVKYQCHVENIGWQGWKTNGETAGTTGQAKRIEGIAIDYKGTGRLEFQCHIQDLGWQSVRNGGEIGGTVGKELRLEAIAIDLKDTSNSIRYRAHIQDIGWTNWGSNGDIVGTIGESKRIEAIEIVV